MLSMLVYFSSAQLAQSRAVAPAALLPLLNEQKTIHSCWWNSHVLTPIPMYLIPIPIPWLILLPFPRESHGTHGIPVFPIPMHTSSLRKRCSLSSRSGVWGGAPAEIEFGEFYI